MSEPGILNCKCRTVRAGETPAIHFSVPQASRLLRAEPIAMLIATFLLVVSAHAAPIASESFDYPLGSALIGGTANGGTGWAGGWKSALWET